MIYILFANGASVVPLFFPWIPQLLLLVWAISVLYYQGFQLKPFILIIIASLILIIFSGIAANNLDKSLTLINMLPNVIVGTLIAAGIQSRYNSRFADVYSQAILVISMLGILGLLIANVSELHISSSIGDRQYHTNLLTTWITDGDFNSSITNFSPLQYRLQSMFDEPGTFAVLLVPAFFHCVFRGKTLMASLLLLAAFLSESAYAWSFCLIILISRMFYIQSAMHKIAYFILFVAFILLTWSSLIYQFQVKTGIHHAYANINSLGVRLTEFRYLGESWSSHLVPMQNQHKINNYFPTGISSGYVNWFFVGGVLFLFIFLSSVTLFFHRLIKHWHNPDPDFKFSIVLAGTMLLSGFHRTSFLDNVLFMSLTFWALSYPVIKKNYLVKAAQ